MASTELGELFQLALKVGINIKEKQYQALLSIVKDSNDTICVLPTGYGKSLINQLLPFKHADKTCNFVIKSTKTQLYADKIRLV